jgi:hypothetical protein
MVSTIAQPWAAACRRGLRTSTPRARGRVPTAPLLLPGAGWFSAPLPPVGPGIIRTVPKAARTEQATEPGIAPIGNALTRGGEHGARLPSAAHRLRDATPMAGGAAMPPRPLGSEAGEVKFPAVVCRGGRARAIEDSLKNEMMGPTGRVLQDMSGTAPDPLLTSFGGNGVTVTDRTNNLNYIFHPKRATSTCTAMRLQRPSSA